MKMKIYSFPCNQTFHDLLTTVKDENWSGMGMQKGQQGLPRQSYKAQCTDREREADRERDGGEHPRMDRPETG